LQMNARTHPCQALITSDTHCACWNGRHRNVLLTLNPRLDYGVAGAGDLLSASARDL
jgi:hypothetical protein